MAARLTVRIFWFLTCMTPVLGAQPPVATASASAPAPVAPPAPVASPAPAASAAALPTVDEKMKPNEIRAIEEENERKEKSRQVACATFVEKLKQRPSGIALTKAQEDAELVELTKCVSAETATTTGAGIGADLVRTVAQVVVDKVQRQGWVVLRDELARVARCPGEDESAASTNTSTTRYPNFCRVLDSATIQDLVAAPEVLLDAAALDLLAFASESARSNPLARDAVNVFLSSDPQAFASFAAAARSQRMTPAAGTPNEAFETARKAAEERAQATFSGILSANRLGSDVLVRRLQQLLLKKARERVRSSIDCEPAWTSPEQTLWVTGMCFIERPSKDALSSCELETWLAKCEDPNDADAARAKAEKALQFLTLAQDVLGNKASSTRAQATVRLVFEMAAALLEETAGIDDGARARALNWLQAFEDMSLGLVGKDWVRTVSGATRTVSFVIDHSGECRPNAQGELDQGACDERKANELKLLTLLGAIGNYALTYETNDEEKAHADREKIMSELVDRMVSRTSRERGAKFSLGGSLGLFGGARTDFDAAQVAFPAQLGLGFGLQSYGRGDGGLHLMVTVLDLGQYVSLDNSELEVEEPDVESAVTLGLTFGGWVWNREVPLYLGAYGGISPFVRDADGDPTYQFGIATGFYAPLLDFN